MIKKEKLCYAQQKKIGLFTTIIIFSIIIGLAVKATIVSTKVYKQNQIIDRKSTIGQKRSEMTKIQKTIKLIENTSYQENLPRKNGFYTNFNKQDFIQSVIAKMNNENDDFDTFEEEKKKLANMEYSGFIIRVNNANSEIEKIIEK